MIKSHTFQPGARVAPLTMAREILHEALYEATLPSTWTDRPGLEQATAAERAEIARQLAKLAARMQRKLRPAKLSDAIPDHTPRPPGTKADARQHIINYAHEVLGTIKPEALRNLGLSVLYQRLSALIKPR